MTSVTLTPDDQRMDRITEAFGAQPFDNVVFRIADDIADNYNGAFWNYYERDGEFFYMAPASEGVFNVTVPGNGFTGEVNADTFGIICTLTALGHLLMHLFKEGNHDQGQRINTLFFMLRDYALDHEKASTIMQAID